MKQIRRRKEELPCTQPPLSITVKTFRLSLVILTVLLDLLLAVVVLVGVALLVRPGQPVHQVVRRLVRDVAQQPLHERQVVLQFVLDRIPLKR